MVAPSPSVAFAPVPRRVLAVVAIATLSLTSMAAGLRLAFPSGVRSRSGAGPVLAPIVISRSNPAAPGATTVTPRTTPASAVARAAQAEAVRQSTTVSVPAPPAPSTTAPPGVVGSAVGTVQDVLGSVPLPATPNLPGR